MTAVYQLLVDVVIAVHLAFVVFVALGALLAFRWRWMPWAHVPAAAWGAWIEITDGICPLTPLENALHRMAGSPGYEGDFVERYITAIVYPSALTRTMQFALAAAVVVVNAAIYVVVWRRGHMT
jgi:uncharacterized protein DUF2784